MDLTDDCEADVSICAPATALWQISSSACFFAGMTPAFTATQPTLVLCFQIVDLCRCNLLLPACCTGPAPGLLCCRRHGQQQPGGCRWHGPPAAAAGNPGAAAHLGQLPHGGPGAAAPAAGRCSAQCAILAGLLVTSDMSRDIAAPQILAAQPV